LVSHLGPPSSVLASRQGREVRRLKPSKSLRRGTGVELVELAHQSGRSPALVELARSREVDLGGALAAAHAPELGEAPARQRLLIDRAVLLRGLDRALVEIDALLERAVARVHDLGLGQEQLAAKGRRAAGGAAGQV